MSGSIALLPWWRHLLLGGACAGLLASAAGLRAQEGWLLPVLLGLPLLAAQRRAASARASGALLHSALLVLLAALAGLGTGDARLRAIAAEAHAGEPGERVRAVGTVGAGPRVSLGRLRFPLETADGRLMVSVRFGGGASVRDPPTVGARVRVVGRLARPEPFREAELRRAGIALELKASSLVGLPGGRGGIGGLLDRVRTRAERGLTAGLGGEPAALARGFVLGQDERIQAELRERFRRSGLAHLLAVSGQNVMLLAVLGGALVTLVGVGPRTRLLLVLLLIAAYVPIAGGAASIQRAGIMGAAGIIAGLAGRPADRLYALLLAALGTLLLNPLAATDVGWQLSFAAVGGIALLTPRLRPLLARSLRFLPQRVATPLAEGAALTLAATLATAPLTVHHFEALSLAALPANLLVLPAVAPVMWLGMAAAMLGQLPGMPSEPLGWAQAPLLSYISLVAQLLGDPRWALARLPAGNGLGVGVAYAALLGGALAAVAALRRRGGLRPAPALSLAVGLVAAAVLALPGPASQGPGTLARGAVRVTQLDVGQGDAILLQSGRSSLLVDTGPAGAGLPEALLERGVERLDAVAITHDQFDHAGGFGELLGRIDLGRLITASAMPGAAAQARAAGVEVTRIGAGAKLAVGRTRLTALWPPTGARDRPFEPDDPNASSLVLVVEHRGWRALLAADAEAESVPIDPGPLDLLKVAHHGSADAGLGALLDRSSPSVALIGVGADNPHGHPAPETAAELAERRVCVLRSDLHGDAWAEIGADGLRVGSERDPDPCPI